MIRLFLEGVAGAIGGAIIAQLVPGSESRIALFVTVGALAAPTALLLTPERGGLPFRAARYGMALAVLVTLATSFLAGAEALRFEQLLAFGLLIFSFGTLWHGLAALLPGAWMDSRSDLQ